MVRLRQVTAVVAAAALCGCAATDRLSAHYLDARRAVGLDPAAARPATQVSLIMQRRLRDLPDPTRADAKQWGLPGQVFLAATDGRPVEASGDLTVTVTDDTPRPPGQAPRTTEKWQFSRDVLTMLKQKDERFGDCYVLFLPWPADWKDVTRVTVNAQYQAAGQIALYAQEVPVTLETGPAQAGGDVWQKVDPTKPPVFTKPAAETPPPAQPLPILLPPPSSGTSQVQPAPAGPQTIEIRRG